MGLFKKMKRTLGYNDRSLTDTGIKGTAKVLSDKDSHFSVGGDDDDGPPIHKSRLLVTLPGQAPYEADYHRAWGLKVENEYEVYVDQKDPKNMFVDAGDGLDAVAAKLSALTGQKVASDPNSIQDAARGMQAQWSGTQPGSADFANLAAQSAKTALSMIQDPAQRKMIIEQYRAAGIPIDDGAPPAP